MIVIVANGGDPVATALIERWGPDAAVLAPEDLSAPGWRQTLGRPGEGFADGAFADGGSEETALVQRRLIPQGQVTGVMTRLAAVSAAELPDIDADDRDFVAAEVTAFLLFWLSRLNCPLLNRPTAMSLSGPLWRAEQWVHAAATAGIRTSSVRRHSHTEIERSLPPSARAVTVIGERCFGDVHAGLAASAKRLAAAAGVAMLGMIFSGADRGAHFLSADLFPPLRSDDEKDAAYDYLCRA